MSSEGLFAFLRCSIVQFRWIKTYKSFLYRQCETLIWWIHHCTLTIIGKKPDSVGITSLITKENISKCWQMIFIMQKPSWYILAINEHWGLKVSKVTDIRPAIASLKEKGTVALSVKWVRLFACKLHFCDFHCHRKHREDEKWVRFFGCLLYFCYFYYQTKVRNVPKWFLITYLK